MNALWDAYVAYYSHGGIFPRQSSNTSDHEYVVVGSGAGGGVVAARLALAGHSVLLIEAGDDQGENLNYSVPAYQARSTEDPLLAWNFFVRHYENDDRQKLDFKLTYTTPDGAEYTGLDPPPGSTIKGILYPRAATLGGCTAHNAMIAAYPDRDDFDNIASSTGDSSWSADNMRQYFVKLEKNEYLQSLISPGHGYNGWLGVDVTPPTLITKDARLLSMVQGAASALSGFYNTVINVASFLAGDANADSAARDSTPSLYQIPIATANGARNTVREFLVSVAGATNADGSKKYPLDIRTNCLATKVNFDNSGSEPRATGVSFLSGASLYRADPRSSPSSSGVPGNVTASHEVIVAGGTYNSPQLLKLSGIGPASELQKFNIPVLVDLPGVGANLQDHYEVAVQGQTPLDWGVLAGCTFDQSPSDTCLRQWRAGTTALDRGTYAAVGFVAVMLLKSSTTPDNNYDEFAFGGPVNFRGYFPGYAVNATDQHNWWTWALLKSHPRSTAGTVLLRSADPRDVPDILYNYFDTGSGDYAADLQTIYESIQIARAAFADATGVPFTEVLPGADVQSQADIEDYIKNTAWGHHASGTCPIGADADANAVLDSEFRVRGTQGLRVVDASVYPKIPGTFTLLSTYLAGEKGADVILQEVEGKR